MGRDAVVPREHGGQAGLVLPPRDTAGPAHGGGLRPLPTGRAALPQPCPRAPRPAPGSAAREALWQGGLAGEVPTSRDRWGFVLPSCISAHTCCLILCLTEILYFKASKEILRFSFLQNILQGEWLFMVVIAIY